MVGQVTGKFHVRPGCIDKSLFISGDMYNLSQYSCTTLGMFVTIVIY